MASGLDLEGKAWDAHVYHPTMWHDDGVERTSANKTQLSGLKMLRDMKANPSAMAAHFASQPAFTREAVANNASDGHKLAHHMEITVDAIKRHTSECMQGGAKKPRTGPPATGAEEAAAKTVKNRANSEKRKDIKREKRAEKAADERDFEMSLASLEQE